MKFSIPTAIAGFLAVASAAPAADANAQASPPSLGPYFLTSYLSSNCDTPTGVTRFFRGACTRLDYPARGVQFVTSAGIPQGCTLQGYVTNLCSGNSFLTITGPSQQRVCYPSNPGIGANAFIRSVRLSCP